MLTGLMPCDCCDEAPVESVFSLPDVSIYVCRGCVGLGEWDARRYAREMRGKREDMARDSGRRL